MLEDLKKLKTEAQKFLKEVKDSKELENLRVKYLGRKGELNKFFDVLKSLSLEEKRKFAPPLQKLKKELEEILDKKISELSQSLKSSGGLDITMPGKKMSMGHLHPLTIVEKEIREIFKAMNFSVVEGPEVESEYYNFDALNIPKSHPARDMWDTFWLRSNQKQLTIDNKQITSGKRSNVKGQMLLRTHTSPVQIRYMEQHKPPFQIIVPGRVFRFEATDASHEINFYQVEGLMVGKDVNLANFKFVIQEFFQRLFKKNLKIRLRPSYFPFVEPGLEVDVQCIRCEGTGRLDGPVKSASQITGLTQKGLPRGGEAPFRGCNLCKESGWLEVMGAGMVHPRVFESAGYNPKDLQGFAFGLGLERIAMIKYNIPDIRLFYSGDLRFIRQF
ncbi:MAG: phenylalanine--tRNA ligase subunit alpha [bacterium]|nr:phenylalanine--tRNA ligase subunit alpha [bacterium]